MKFKFYVPVFAGTNKLNVSKDGKTTVKEAVSRTLFNANKIMSIYVHIPKNDTINKYIQSEVNKSSLNPGYNFHPMKVIVLQEDIDRINSDLRKKFGREIYKSNVIDLIYDKVPIIQITTKDVQQKRG